ncbi:hypothetical protein [Blastococcus sp. TF02A-30]|uniref:hypothetical protein n=1 Tax=Blastococcus sp. TF02A-30 TaxID=2250580 RepID=UPI000DEB4041|nr:hypothetical protein [Blastococcus sp. TF02A-30]RBY90978.1 hypothetical protein DQ241_04645 [Blastococcus sp. TF02A-30]
MTVQADRSQEAGSAPRRPNLDGDLDELLDDPGPHFRTALRGYDRVQVDNYVIWAEAELAAARQAAAEQAARAAAHRAELQALRDRAATSGQATEYARLSERFAEMLRLATEEATAVREAGAAEAAEIVASARAEAEEIVGSARAEADLTLRRAQKLEADAASRRAEAEQVVAAAQETAAARVAEALDAAAGRLAETESRVAELHRRGTELRAVLDALAGRTDQALRTLADGAVEAPVDAEPEPEVVHQSRPMVVHRTPAGAQPVDRTQLLPAVPAPGPGRRPEAEPV